MVNIKKIISICMAFIVFISTLAGATDMPKVTEENNESKKINNHKKMIIAAVGTAFGVAFTLKRNRSNFYHNKKIAHDYFLDKLAQVSKYNTPLIVEFENSNLSTETLIQTSKEIYTSQKKPYILILKKSHDTYEISYYSDDETMEESHCAYLNGQELINVVRIQDFDLTKENVYEGSDEVFDRIKKEIICSLISEKMIRKGISRDELEIYVSEFINQIEKGKSYKYAETFISAYSEKYSKESEDNAKIYALAYAEKIDDGKESYYSKNYATVYAEKMAEGQSDSYSKEYTYAYLEKIAETENKNKSNFYAITYANQRINGNRSLEYSTLYANTYVNKVYELENGSILDKLFKFFDNTNTEYKNHGYADAYSMQIAEGKSNKFASYYAQQIVKCEKAEYAEIYAKKMTEGKSVNYTKEYLLKIKLGKSPEFSEAFASQKEAGKSEIFASLYATKMENGYNDETSKRFASEYIKVFNAFETNSMYSDQYAVAKVIWNKSNKFAKMYAEIYVNSYTKYDENHKCVEEYAIKIAEGKSKIYADAYAICKVLNDENDENSSVFAKFIDEGKSYTYAFQYIQIRTSKKDDLYAQKYTDAYCSVYEKYGCNHNYSREYGIQIAEGKSVKYAETYARLKALSNQDDTYILAKLKMDDKDLKKSSKLYEENFSKEYNIQISNGKSKKYANAYAECKTNHNKNDAFAASLAEQVDEGKSYTYAFQYIRKIRTSKKDDLYAQKYADAYCSVYEKYGHRNHNYAFNYGTQIAEGKSKKYAKIYAKCIALNGYDNSFANKVAKLVDEGESYNNALVKAGKI